MLQVPNGPELTESQRAMLVPSSSLAEMLGEVRTEPDLHFPKLRPALPGVIREPQRERALGRLEDLHPTKVTRAP